MPSNTNPFAIRVVITFWSEESFTKNICKVKLRRINRSHLSSVLEREKTIKSIDRSVFSNIGKNRWEKLEMEKKIMIKFDASHAIRFR